MFFNRAAVAKAIDDLRSVHPFHGITYLACKLNRLPIGIATEFQMDSYTNEFLETYHRPDPESAYFVQTYPTTSRWVKHDYASSGLQAINTQTFAAAFIHERNTKNWGWQPNYVDILEGKLKGGNRLPAFSLAVWLYRDRDWSSDANIETVLATFFSEFDILDEERERLFLVPDMAELDIDDFLAPEPLSKNELLGLFPPAPDASPEEGGTLSFIGLENVGPIERAELHPSRRLTLITGDNGLGKTFLLECAWWALTGIWAGAPAFPKNGYEGGESSISFSIETDSSTATPTAISFDWDSASWPKPDSRPTIPGLLVYARVDGSFAVWDPEKRVPGKSGGGNHLKRSVFSSSEVWDGLTGSIEGLIRDWVRWQNSSTSPYFGIFKSVLERLSPPDLGPLRPGEPIRLPGEPREIPTLEHPYGTTPIIFASAGVKRIVTLSYLIVWAWIEHTIAASQMRHSPQQRMVVLVDEMEAHLHPHWQREVLPAVMSIGEFLNADLEIQFLVATHSPLVMASSETLFDSELDSLVHIGLDADRRVAIQELDFVRFGDASSWLMSPVFELQHARSRAAEEAIEKAKELQLSDPDCLSRNDVQSATEALIRYLGPDDKFWPRWIAFAEMYGVEL